MKISGPKTLEVFWRSNSFGRDHLKQVAMQHHQFITNLAQPMYRSRCSPLSS
jgi:hypothetical protein